MSNPFDHEKKRRSEAAALVRKKFENPSENLRRALEKVAACESSSNKHLNKMLDSQGFPSQDSLRKGHLRLGGGLAGRCWAVLLQWDEVTKLSPADRTSKMRAIAKAARLLAKLLRTTPELASHGAFEFISEHSEYSSPPKVPPTDKTYTASHQLPNIQELLEVIAQTAEFRTRRKPFVAKMKDLKVARRNFFIRELHSTFMIGFGIPLHEVVAVATSEIFDEMIDADLVRKLCYPPYRKKTRQKKRDSSS